MASYNKPRTVNGVINTVYNAEDYADQSQKGEYVDKSSNESVGGLKTFTTGITNTGNTVIGDASSDTLTVNATSTFNAPVNLTNATGSIIPGTFIKGDGNNSLSMATPNTLTGGHNTFINSPNINNITGTANVIIKGGGGLTGIASSNVVMGHNSMSATTTGSDNVVLGTLTKIQGNINRCVYIGYGCGQSATGNINNNLCIGTQSARHITGSNNLVLGIDSATNDTLTTTLINSTFLGNNTTSTGNFNNSTCIGNLSQITAHNQMVFGISSVTLNSPNLSGTGNRALYADPNGNFTTSSSDSRLKENIVYLVNSESLTKLLQLKPAKWDWIKNGNKDYGLIAQDLQSVMPDLVFSTPDYSNVEYDISTNEIIESTIEHYLGINYHQLTPYLISSIQALNTKINDQNTMISSLMLQVASLMDRVSTLEQG